MCTRTRALDVRPPKWYQEDRGADASLVGQANFDRKKQVAPGSRSHFRSFLEPAGRGWGGGARALLLLAAGKEPALCHPVTGLIASCPL